MRTHGHRLAWAAALAGFCCVTPGCGGGEGSIVPSTVQDFALATGATIGDSYTGTWFPLGLGRAWTYDVTTTTCVDTPQGAGRETETNRLRTIASGTRDLSVDGQIVRAIQLDTVAVLPVDDAGLRALASARPTGTSEALDCAVGELVADMLGTAKLRTALVHDVTFLGSTFHVIRDDGSVEKVAVDGDSGTVPVLAAPRPTIPAVLTVHEPEMVAWEGGLGSGTDGTGGGSNDLEQFDLQRQRGFAVAGRDSVTTPAGRFEAVCIYERVTLVGTGRPGTAADGAAVTGASSAYTWLVDGIGMVRGRSDVHAVVADPGEGRWSSSVSSLSALVGQTDVSVIDQITIPGTTWLGDQHNPYSVRAAAPIGRDLEVACGVSASDESPLTADWTVWGDGALWAGSGQQTDVSMVPAAAATSGACGERVIWTPPTVGGALERAGHDTARLPAVTRDALLEGAYRIRCRVSVDGGPYYGSSYQPQEDVYLYNSPPRLLVRSLESAPGGSVDLCVGARAAYMHNNMPNDSTPGATWAATGGSLSSTGFFSARWTAPNLPGDYRITYTRQMADRPETGEVTIHVGPPSG